MPTSVGWEIVERLVVSRTGSLADCEDAIVVTDAYAAVIDGATSKTTRRWDGMTGGQAAAALIGATIMQLPPDLSARAALDTITARIAAFYDHHGAAERVRADPVQRVTAALALVSFARAECWVVGDCQCLVGARRYAPELPVDAVTSQARAFFLESELLRGATLDELRAHDPGRAFIAPLLARQAWFQNNPAARQLGYAAVDGFPIADDGIVVLPIDPEVETLVLASDGYPFLAPTLAESEARLQALLADDPLLFRTFRSTKGLAPGQVSFDDRSYLRLARARAAG